MADLGGRGGYSHTVAVCVHSMPGAVVAGPSHGLVGDQECKEELEASATLRASLLLHQQQWLLLGMQLLNLLPALLVLARLWLVEPELHVV